MWEGRLARRISVPYGTDNLDFELPPDKIVAVADLPAAAAAENPLLEVERALKAPVSSPPLRELAKKGHKVVIVVNDITRPTPTALILQPILDELKQAGIREAETQIIVATGLHEANSDKEMERVVGPFVFDRYEVTCHNPEEKTVFLGTSSRGTPLAFNRDAVKADLRILTGSIEPHQLAGYTGGAKSLLPGLSSRETIEKNHSLLLDHNVAAGLITKNPLRKEIDESVGLFGATFLLNVVLNLRDEIVGAVAGDVIEAHRQGAEVCNRVSRVYVPGLADIVIASPGGFPEDIDLYQGQKAVTQAEKAVKRGGVIILVSKCERGLGDGLFREWMCEEKRPEDIIERMRREGFKMGAHKAFLFARTMLNVDLIVVSDIPDKALEEMHLTPASSIEEALELAYRKVGRDSKVTVLPNASRSLVSVTPSRGEAKSSHALPEAG